MRSLLHLLLLVLAGVILLVSAQNDGFEISEAPPDPEEKTWVNTPTTPLKTPPPW